MCVYRGSAGGAAEMNEPHPSLLGHHSLTSDEYTKNPSIHPPIPSYCVSPDLSSRVIKSSGQAHRIIRGRTIKVQKLSIS